MIYLLETTASAITSSPGPLTPIIFLVHIGKLSTTSQVSRCSAGTPAMRRITDRIRDIEKDPESVDEPEEEKSDLEHSKKLIRRLIARLYNW